MTTTIEINGTGKKALADVNIYDDEVTVLNLTVFNDNGKITYYNKKQCARHQWPLYLAVKKHLYE